MKYNLFKYKNLKLKLYVILTIILTCLKDLFATRTYSRNSFNNKIKTEASNSNLNSNLNSISISNSIKNEKSTFGAAALVSAEMHSQMQSLFSFGLKSLADLKKMKSENRFQGFPKAAVDLNNTAEIGSGPIYFEGWNKYFILKNKKGFEMKEFYLNGAYFKEQSQQFHLNHKNEAGNFIPNPNEFYTILTEEYLTVVSSKFVG